MNMASDIAKAHAVDKTVSPAQFRPDATSKLHNKHIGAFLRWAHLHMPTSEQGLWDVYDCKLPQVCPRARAASARNSVNVRTAARLRGLRSAWCLTRSTAVCRRPFREPRRRS